MQLKEIAHARSGDKGADVNIGLIAYNAQGYKKILESVTLEKLSPFFSHAKEIRLYRWDKLLMLNVVLIDVLDPLAPDSQGKSWGQKLLEMHI